MKGKEFNLPTIVSAAVSEFGSSGYSLSLSIGCAAWEEGKNVIEVLHEADQNMYRDKKRRW